MSSPKMNASTPKQRVPEEMVVMIVSSAGFVDVRGDRIVSNVISI